MPKNSNYKKTSPTIFPMGFAVSQVDGGKVVVIDFLDKDSNEVFVVGSFALTAEKIKDLVTALTQDADFSA